MNGENHKEIMYKLGELSEGMRGVHSRLDKINGAIQKHEQDILNLKFNKSYVLGAAKIISFLIGAFGAIIGLIIPFLINYFF
ncbi:MAG: hypothetical protein AAB706_02110 [Patescibacteria group bacterium]